MCNVYYLHYNYYKINNTFSCFNLGKNVLRNIFFYTGGHQNKTTKVLYVGRQEDAQP